MLLPTEERDGQDRAPPGNLSSHFSNLEGGRPRAEPGGCCHRQKVRFSSHSSCPPQSRRVAVARGWQSQEHLSHFAASRARRTSWGRRRGQGSGLCILGAATQHRTLALQCVLGSSPSRSDRFGVTHGDRMALLRWGCAGQSPDLQTLPHGDQVVTRLLGTPGWLSRAPLPS